MSLSFLEIAIKLKRMEEEDKIKKDLELVPD